MCVCVFECLCVPADSSSLSTLCFVVLFVVVVVIVVVVVAGVAIQTKVASKCQRNANKTFRLLLSAVA